MDNVLIFNNHTYNLLFYFMIYSILGWILEVIFAFFDTKEFVNRGFLYGPFCPIYGLGALSLIIFLQPLMNNIFLLLIGAFLFPSLVEYIIGFILETLFNTTWWDYSDSKFNLHGRICLTFSTAWWLLSLFFLFILHPHIIKPYVDLIPLKLGYIILYSLIIYFLFDFMLTLISLLQFKELIFELIDVTKELKIRSEFIKKLKELPITSELSATARQLGQKVSDKLENTVGNLTHKLNNAIENLTYKNENKSLKSDLEDFYKLESKVDELKVTHDKLINKIVNNYTRIFKAYPHLKAKHSNGILLDIKNKIKTLNIKKK